MYQYEKEKYIGRKIQLFPCDTISKWGTIKLTQIQPSDYKHGFNECKTYFINHSSNITFKFMD